MTAEGERVDENLQEEFWREFYSNRPTTFVADDTPGIWNEIKRLGLESNIAELETLGYTVVPAAKVGEPDFIIRLRDKVLDVAHRRYGVKLDLNDAAMPDDPKAVFQRSLTYLLYEDQIFQDAVLHPVALALSDYALGKNAVLSNCVSFIKSRGGQDLPLHVDNQLMSAPFPPHYQVLNVTWLLTDYSRENGASCFVPGTHRYYRAPAPGEGDAHRVAIEAPAGSMVVWTGNVWHGAFARHTNGLRATLAVVTMRPHLRPQEAYRENVTQEILARNPPRFAKLVGQHINFGWKEEGPQGGAAPYDVGRHVYD